MRTGREDRIMWIAGLDPGGDGKFGRCAVHASEGLPLRLHRLGVESNAAAAVACDLKAVPTTELLIAAGIDSALFWSARADRNADRRVRTRCRVWAQRRLLAPLSVLTRCSEHAWCNVCLPPRSQLILFRLLLSDSRRRPRRITYAMVMWLLFVA